MALLTFLVKRFLVRCQVSNCNILGACHIDFSRYRGTTMKNPGCTPVNLYRIVKSSPTTNNKWDEMIYHILHGSAAVPLRQQKNAWQHIIMLVLPCLALLLPFLDHSAGHLPQETYSLSAFGLISISGGLEPHERLPKTLNKAFQSYPGICWNGCVRIVCWVQIQIKGNLSSPNKLTVTWNIVYS